MDFDGQIDQADIGVVAQGFVELSGSEFKMMLGMSGDAMQAVAIGASLLFGCTEAWFWEEDSLFGNALLFVKLAQALQGFIDPMHRSQTKKVLRAGGELLERYRQRRGKADDAALFLLPTDFAGLHKPDR